MLTRTELQRLGFDGDDVLDTALAALAQLDGYGHAKKRLKRDLELVRRDPARHFGHAVWDALARLLAAQAGMSVDGLRTSPVPGRVWGRRLMDARTLEQFDTACRLPVAARGAQMPDGHPGYGLPIGGVLATRGVVIPYAVGVDIACRMRLSVFEEPVGQLKASRERLKKALLTETRFGVGAEFDAGSRREHAMLDDPAWGEQKLLAGLKDRAWAQLGSSGSGNHFVEWGELTTEGVPELDLAAGTYLALLSHSGSRGLGAQIAAHFTRVAKARTVLPKQAADLAWLDLESHDGQAYWQAMNLAGRFAAANHELIHRHVAKAARLQARTHVENHHNFAWLETYDGEELVVHRKGATPAGVGVLGVIPGSMGDAGYVVRGRGNEESLCSASHGAGRVLSRKQANATLIPSQRRDWLERMGVELLAAGIDESPQVYKRLDEVMAEQQDLVAPVASFMPRIVLMAAGGPAED